MAVAFVLLLVAMGAVVSFQREAQAFDNDLDVTVSQNTAGPIAPGATVTYTIDFDASTFRDSAGNVSVGLTWNPANAIGDATVSIHSKTGDFAGSGGGSGAACAETVDNTGSPKSAQCVTARQINDDSTFQVTVTCETPGTIPAPALAISDSAENLPSNQLTNNTTAVECVAVGGGPVQPDVQVVLRHVNEYGDVLDARIVPNNVRGHRHIVCAFTNDQGLAPAEIPLSADNVRVVPSSPGLVAPEIYQPGDADYPFTEGDQADGASCFEWTSTSAGDQEITLVYPGTSYTAGFGTGQAIIKEWNVLDESCVEVWQGDELLGEGCDVDGTPGNPTVEVTVPALFDPSDSSYRFGDITVVDSFIGSHTTTAGQPWSGALWGVEYTWRDLSPGECGDIWAFGDGVTGQNGQAVIDIDDGTDSNCLLNDKIVIEISGCEPGPIGSTTETDCVTQVVVINLETPQETKDVFLAWAGQRVIIEHDWRLPPGDWDDGDDWPEPNGDCAFDDPFAVKYTAQQGSVGTWLSSLGALSANNNTAFVLVSDYPVQDNVPYGPQDSCISRAIYQSNFPGEVVINAEVAISINDDEEYYYCQSLGFLQPECGFNQTNKEVVIYYMKIEQVETTLVTTQSKPTHNAVGMDWAPGNPWDVSLDVTSTEANVSEDVLVRVRVTGWFPGSNLSGRPAVTAAEDPQNPRPADRWVMPYDWAMLAGGPKAADNDWTDEVGGTAEDFSPHYDLMFAPNNTAGIVMDAPDYVESGDPPFEGPLSLLDYKGWVDYSAALSDHVPGDIKWTTYSDGDVDRYDAPMPPAELTVNIRGAGFIRGVYKEDVYYLGTPDSASQTYPNPYYITDIPASPFIPAQTAGGGYLWNTWGNDGPGGLGHGVYWFWEPIWDLIEDVPGESATGVYDTTLSSAELDELELIREAHDDDSISRTLVVYTDNHGEAMVAANGDFKLDYRDCTVNPLEGGHHCAEGDEVGASTIWAVAQYPDAKGHHAPVTSNTVDITWTWGGYKEITIEDGETEQFKYVVFHAVDRDGFCSPNFANGGVSLHPVLSDWDDDYDFDFPQHHGDPVENVDFLIDGGQGRIVNTSDGQGPISGELTNAFGITTFSTGENNPATSGIVEFPTLNDGDECQAWIRISSSLLDTIDVYAVAHDDEGDIGFDELINFTSSHDYMLSFRWSLITWAGANGISPEDALTGEGLNEGGNDIMDQVTAVYGWNQAAQTWLGFFPAGVGIPGVNDLTELETGKAYWIAIVAPGPVSWTVDTNVN